MVFSTLWYANLKKKYLMKIICQLKNKKKLPSTLAYFSLGWAVFITVESQFKKDSFLFQTQDNPWKSITLQNEHLK